MLKEIEKWKNKNFINVSRQTMKDVENKLKQ